MEAPAPPLGLAADDDDPARSIGRAVGKLWWLWIVFAVFWFAVAFVVLQFDQASIKTVGVLIGFMFLFAAAQQFVIAMFAGGWARWVLVFFGVLLLVAAVLSFIEPEETFAGVADILGFVFFIIGVFWTVQAFAERGMNPLWWISLITGILTIVLGFWTAGQFFIEKAYVLLVFAGIWALFQGVTDLIRAFQIRAIREGARVGCIALIALALFLGGCGGGDGGRAADRSQADAPPATKAAMPRAPAPLAKRLVATQRGLDDAVDAWREHGDPAKGAPPEAVTLYALDQQRIHILLSGRPRLAHDVLGHLPGRVAAHARASIRARRMLGRLSTPQPLSRFATGPARPAGQLLGFYREAQRRFGVSWRVLAAVNLVESAFGRMRNHSTAGAQGPMQFIPATWAAYGHGREHPRSARRHPRRRELPARQRRAARLPARALPLQPERATWTPCSPTPAASAATRATSSPTTRGRCSSGRRAAPGASPAPGSRARRSRRPPRRRPSAARPRRSPRGPAGPRPRRTSRTPRSRARSRPCR